MSHYKQDRRDDYSSRDRRLSRDDDKHDRDKDRSREGDRSRDRHPRSRSRSREHDRHRDTNRKYDDSNPLDKDYYRSQGGDNSQGRREAYTKKRSKFSSSADCNDGGSGSNGRHNMKPEKEVWGNIAQETETDKSKKINANVPEEEKVKANFGLTGALAKDAATGNVVKGQVLKFSEPLDAAIATKQWRLYVFKGEEVVETLYIHRKSVFLIGRDERIADIVTLHESCSKQHAVIQFRGQPRKDDENDEGETQAEAKPYLMDLGTPNQTFLNGVAIEEARYYELRESDVIKFGASTRDYVLLHGSSTT